MRKGMKKTCVITGEMFYTNNPEECVAPNTMKHITKGLKKDKRLLKEVITATLKDTSCVQLLASAVMNCSAEKIGLKYPGTLAEFFSVMRSAVVKSKTRKADKKV